MLHIPLSTQKSPTFGTKHYNAEDFCSIIIEACPHRPPPNWRYNFCFVHQCSVLHSFGQTKNNSRIVINCRLNWHELSLLSMSRSLHIIRFLHTASRSIFIHNTTASESPQISYRAPETCREFHTRFSKIKFLTNFLNISLRMCRKMITFVPEFNLRREFSKISIEWLIF